MGRYFAANEMKQIARLTEIDSNFYLINEIQRNSQLAAVFNELTEQSKYLVHPLNSQSAEGYYLVNDVFGKPVGFFRIVVPRNIWQQGLKTGRFFIVSFILAGILIMALLWIFTKKLIVSRLLRVSHEVVDIGDQSKFASRIKVSGDDELTNLSKSVNTLLDVIESTQAGLEKRVRERTEDLVKINEDLRDEIMKREQIEEQLRVGERKLDHLAHHDPLTGLPNRALFNELLTRNLADARRHKREVAVLFLDLDRFKNINDALGHQAGDEFLQSLAAQFEQNLRGADVVSRLGGDEFLFFISDFKKAAEIERVAQKILTIVSMQQTVAGQSVQLSGSIGIAVFPTDGSTLEELISNADVAMYKAKELGKNQFHFYKEIFNIRAKEELKLESDLRDAITDKSFRVFFQPIIDLPTHKIIGSEALVRWQHPEFGLLQPDRFIALAEKTGLIVPLGELVLREALLRQQAWKASTLSLKFVTVNCSAVQFRGAAFLDMVTAALGDTKSAGTDLVLEITESILIESEEVAIAKLQALKRMGVKIAIDDFGTGYSSLSYLQKFPVDYLKIDRAFVKNIPDDKDSCAITNAIIVLAHTLNMKTIAEGVETKSQFEYLQEHGCDLIQGFLVSRPLAKENMDDFLSHGISV
jgi:diguanylate cyclase (GGDEF)-like protein